MPGKGKSTLRPYSPEGRAAIEQGAEALGLSAEEALAQLRDRRWTSTRTMSPTGDAWRRGCGGYQVMKKWLSYRERALLGRDLGPEEAREVMRMARRIAAILLLQPELDANYLAVKGNAWEWRSPSS